MSTKFSVRPAPRKRPWICKRSPPCLIPPPLPTSLVATFSLTKIHPPPRGPTFSGTILLEWRPMMAHYKGSWLSPPNGYTLTFRYTPLTGAQHASAEWDLGGLLEWAAYRPATSQPPPNLRYTSSIALATTYSWEAQLLITA